MVSSAKLRGICSAVVAFAVMLSPALAQKKAIDSSEATQESASVRDKDDPRARAEYLEKRRSGGKPVPRAARLNALRAQQQMMVNEGKAFWEKRLTPSSSSTTTQESTSTAPQTTAAAPETNAAPPALSASQWVNIGPTSTVDVNGSRVAGRVTALAIDPSNANTIYLGGAQGGVWKTTNGGTTWTPLTDNQLSLATGSIVIDPNNTQTIYVGTGEENFGSDSYYGVGILKSTDGGATWANVAGNSAFGGVAEPECNTGPTDTFIQGIGGGCGGLRIGSLAMNSGVLLAAVQGGFSNSGGLYRSINGGVAWSLVTGIAPESGNRYTADSVVFVNSTTAYAGIRTNSPGTVPQGVYRSVDSGATWTQWNGGIANVSLTGRVNLTGANDGTVYAAFETHTSSTLAGLFKLAPGGTTWTQLSGVPDFCGGNGTGQCFYDMLVAVNPLNSNVLFIGGSGFPNAPPNPAPAFLYHATDGGTAGATSWIQDTTNIHADQHAGAFTPDGTTFYIGNDGGAYKTSSIGAGAVTWTELNDTLGLTQFYGYFTMDPANSQITYGGTQDNATQKFTGDLIWSGITCGDGAGAVIDSNSGRVFANCNNIDIRESASGAPGSFSNGQRTGIPAETSAFIPPMIGDRSNPQRLYFGTNKIYQATSAATLSWNLVSTTGIVTGSTAKAVTNIDVSADGNTVYSVSEDGKVFKGTNMLGTPSFTDVTGSSQFPAGNYITAVRISPGDPSANTAYISLSGFVAGQHIFRTTVGGLTWTNASGDLPNTPVNDLVIDPDLPNTLYAATDVGVFVSRNDGTNWSPLQTLLPRIAVLGLKLHRASRTLRAATHGRGMWDLYVPSCDPAAGPCLVASPTALNLGSLAVGTSGTPQTITITNTGIGTLTVSGVTLAGADFTQTNNCSSLAQNASCTINVIFSPRAGLSRTGSITIFSNGGNPTVISLTGTGIVVPGNDNFASGMTIGALPFSITVVNNGATTETTDPLPDSACVGGYDPPTTGGYPTGTGVNHHSLWFFYTPLNSGTVTADTSQTVGVDTVIAVFTGSPGSFSEIPGGCNDDINPGVIRQSTLSFSVTAGVTYRILVAGYYPTDFGTIIFTLTGNTTGTSLSISPSNLSFTALLNRPSGAQSVTITNNSGSPQSMGSITVGGDYAITSNSCPGSLGTASSCSVAVTLTPQAVGQRNSVLTINDGAAGTPQTVPLNGFAFNFNLNNPRPHRSNRSGNVVQGMRQQFTVALDTATGGGTIPVSVNCADAPPGSTCTVAPSQVTAGDGSTELMVTFQTRAGGVVLPGSSRARRLGGGTPPGSYDLKLTARVGDAEKQTIIPVTVIAATASRSVRISH